MIYGDTSFLFGIYNPADRFHQEAVKLAAKLREPFALTQLGELELINGLQRGLASKTITLAEHDSILRQIHHDESDGILVRKSPTDNELYTRARDLSKKYTKETSSRSLDILHVAAAQLLTVSAFLSFDDKQRLLVKKTGVKLFPQSVQTR